VLANGVAVLVAFILFFAIKELERVFGSDKIFALFFQRDINVSREGATKACGPA
jgi:hypothetical protein